MVLIGLLGGVALGAVAGARRTQASYATYLATTNPSDLQNFTAFANPALGSSVGYNATTDAKILRLPYVRSEEAVVGFDGNSTTSTGCGTTPNRARSRRSSRVR